MKSVGSFYALIRSVRDLNAQGINQRWSFSLSLFDQRGFFSRIKTIVFDPQVLTLDLPANECQSRNPHSEHGDGQTAVGSTHDDIVQNRRS